MSRIERTLDTRVGRTFRQKLNWSACFLYLKPETLRYTIIVIRTFRHKGLEAFFRNGNLSGIQPHHAARLMRLLARLDTAKLPRDMNLAGWSFHRLSGTMDSHFSVSVSGNWRLTFRLDGGDAYFVDYLDYH